MPAATASRRNYKCAQAAACKCSAASQLVTRQYNCRCYATGPPPVLAIQAICAHLGCTYDADPRNILLALCTTSTGQRPPAYYSSLLFSSSFFIFFSSSSPSPTLLFYFIDCSLDTCCRFFILLSIFCDNLSSGQSFILFFSLSSFLFYHLIFACSGCIFKHHVINSGKLLLT